MKDCNNNRIMVSACLLGENCKYSGGNNLSEELVRSLKDMEVIPVCPEVMGGLPIPRKPGEIVDGVVRNEDGTLVDAEYRRGAELALELAKNKDIKVAVLQSRSPSCGVGIIYDGTFSGVLIEGMGVAAGLLAENGIEVHDVKEWLEKDRK
ncbi:MAG: DUF523 domain-containing protein [Mogibacterium sp.]|nr:DUF523 domain-containing protein [Mogibacterium sp.]